MPVPLNTTISHWQADAHEIGVVAFHPVQAAGTKFPYYNLPGDETFIGVMEVDALCVHSDDSVRVYDHECQNLILCLAAIDQRSFVAAMHELERYFNRCMEDENYCDDMDVAASVRDRCVELAGGDRCLAFFTSMVGV